MYLSTNSLYLLLQPARMSQLQEGRECKTMTTKLKLIPESAFTIENTPELREKLEEIGNLPNTNTILGITELGREFLECTPKDPIEWEIITMLSFLSDLLEKQGVVVMKHFLQSYIEYYSKLYFIEYYSKLEKAPYASQEEIKDMVMMNTISTMLQGLISYRVTPLILPQGVI